MRLYSLQMHEWTVALMADGVIYGDRKRVLSAWLSSYAWMRDQMSQRLAGFSGQYPVWAWKSIPYLLEGDKWLVVELDVPDSRVLLSDFPMWDSMLSIASEQRKVPPRLGRLPDRDSANLWLRMFDRDVIQRARSTDIQACIDGVYAHEVRTASRVRWQ